MVIDSHTHIGDFGGIGEGRAAMLTMDLIRSMDEAGIDVSLVIANNLKNEEEGTDSEELIEEIQKFPNRLRAIANIDFPRITEQNYSNNLLKILEHSAVVGLKFYSGYQHYDPADEKLTQFYAFCQSENMPVIFHTGYLLEGSSGSKDYSHPGMLSSLAQKFPQLTIIAAHFGNPWIQECGELIGKYPNVYADLSGYFIEFQPISEKQKKEFQNDIALLKQTAGSLEKCLFGTDWWLYSQKEYLEAAQELPMTEKEKELIFSKNAQTLFNIQI